MGRENLDYHKEKSSNSNYFIFWKIYFQYKNLKIVGLIYQLTMCPYSYLL